MAWQVVTDVQYHAPRNLTPGELAVLLAIADAVRQVDVGARRARCSHDEVAWKARVDVKSVGDLVARLVRKGALRRVPIREDHRGQPVYTYRGAVPSYVVSAFDTDADACPCFEHHAARLAEGPTTVGPSGQEGPTTVDPSDAEGPTTIAEGPTTIAEGPTTIAEGPTVVGPHRVSPGLSGKNRGDARTRDPAPAVVVAPRDDPPTGPVIDGEVVAPARRFPAQCDAHQDRPNTRPCFPCKAAREARRKPRSTLAHESVDALFDGWQPPTAPPSAPQSAAPPAPPPRDESPADYWDRVRRRQERHG